jgi:CheY-like chemotaxis protein
MISTARCLQHVLLVEDDTDDNFFHRRAIERSGLAVSVAECLDGQEALDLLLGDEGLFDGDSGGAGGSAELRTVPDLIFLDLNMPGLNGWDFVEALAANVDRLQHDAPRIVLLSTAPDGVTRRRAEASPFIDESLAKPLRTEDFLRVAAKYFPAGGS